MGRERYVVRLDREELDQLELAYAVSVHKSQGSEYQAVIVPVMTQHYLLLQRNLLYTAVTRGKKLVVLIGTTQALNIAVKNDKTMRRHSLLADMLWPVGPGIVVEGQQQTPRAANCAHHALHGEVGIAGECVALPGRGMQLENGAEHPREPRHQ